ncbi:MAG: hypothetical protein A3D67_01380 [Candidatus Lloydbacteria bacterium RIFCSPHIGHO2_02_FULL_51_22]|uniref:Uncharacterized protein n=3 Tax=Candidatus Lloydiibacteriota TaxID=1817910 RepID=A0A1G2DBA0_9BACT|nr:MAG: hypothetical protein A3D67_01380 [Candidatus Lloydbacteria bacterium RIFCSPHIGHO2_02_FULL_51_22]OGZ15794.1 MAG: hypothetical protein A3J08_00200 [Candidatus Lloydbacteria bacterium RIFCSPLOWO2_02_FULL_51_11]OGZ16981.1 MAG: hypothetical protein A3G11_00055 [Candidatus Lloydbacteria bacterium RIFCSPLOWO2_12_FULL_51_9]
MELIRACFLCGGGIEKRHESVSNWDYVCTEESCGVLHSIYFRIVERGYGAIVCAVTMRESLYVSAHVDELVRESFFKKCVVCQGTIIDGTGVGMCEREGCGVEYTRSVTRRRGHVAVLIVMKMTEGLFNALLSGDAPQN